MPEGDTLHRTARSLETWVGGRSVTAASSTMGSADLSRVVGRTITVVEARGKNLVMTFAAPNRHDLLLHTHMRMTGSWHVYERGVRWHRAPHRARLVIECGDRLAVCFDVPVARLDTASAIESTSALHSLGPDILDTPLALDRIRRRARSSSAPTIAELLLDQRVVAGIGNVYRCEVLFAHRIDPWTAPSAMADGTLDALLGAAAAMMHANVGHPSRRDTGAGPGRAFVHQRTGRPCRRCATPVRSVLLGDPVRRLYWCPVCQGTAAR